MGGQQCEPRLRKATEIKHGQTWKAGGDKTTKTEAYKVGYPG